MANCGNCNLYEHVSKRVGTQWKHRTGYCLLRQSVGEKRTGKRPTHLTAWCASWQENKKLADVSKMIIEEANRRMAERNSPDAGNEAANETPAPPSPELFTDKSFVADSQFSSTRIAHEDVEYAQVDEADEEADPLAGGIVDMVTISYDDFSGEYIATMPRPNGMDNFVGVGKKRSLALIHLAIELVYHRT